VVVAGKKAIAVALFSTEIVFGHHHLVLAAAGGQMMLLMMTMLTACLRIALNAWPVIVTITIAVLYSLILRVQGYSFAAATGCSKTKNDQQMVAIVFVGYCSIAFIVVDYRRCCWYLPCYAHNMAYRPIACCQT
jgi:hypothetical protein